MTNRIIKFRAWDGMSETMIQWDELLHPNTKHRSLINLLVNLPQDHKCILMQFTGLLDKNGKEIYEGDIVQYVKGNERGWKWEVFWESEGKWRGRHKSSNPQSLAKLAPNHEIIGNIHENPDLIR